MRFISPSPEPLAYTSVSWHLSEAFQGVRFGIRRVSLLQRIELTKKVRELSSKYDFLKAGDALEQTEATMADLLVRRLYIEWGLESIEGLKIDGNSATVELLIEKGPERLSDEIVTAIRATLELSEDERKNS